MNSGKLSRLLHKIRGTKEAWWYEEPKGICVVVRANTQSSIIDIPWHSIRRALKRKDGIECGEMTPSDANSRPFSKDPHDF